MSHYSSTLQRLTVDYKYVNGSETAILTFLDVLRATEDEAEPVICPNLISLHLAHIIAGDDYAQALSDCVRSRYERGFRLSHLFVDTQRDWQGEGLWISPDLSEYVDGEYKTCELSSNNKLF